jgi:hypothetical protein
MTRATHHPELTVLAIIEVNVETLLHQLSDSATQQFNAITEVHVVTPD